MPQATSLRGQCALITGGAKRLGAAIALDLADAGVNLAIHYRSSRDAAEQVAAQARAQGVQAACFSADLGRAEEAAGLIDSVRAKMGPVQVLINSASIFDRDGLSDFTPEALDENVRVNALAPALIARAFAAQTEASAIVNLLDTMIRDYDKLHAAYHLSKRMFAALSRMMAVEYAPKIRVNAVAPGLILPPEGADEGYLERLASTNPLQSHGEAADISAAVRFLLSSPFVTGQTLYVDGGRHLKGSMYE